MNDVWDFCQASNRYLGIAVAVLVMYRLTPMVLDRARWRNPQARHRLLLFAYFAVAGIVSSLLATYYRSHHAEPGIWSGAQSLTSAFAIVLCLWWPHPTRLEEEVE